MLKSVEIYKRAESVWSSIDDAYNEIENGKVSDIRIDFIVGKTLDEIHQLYSLLNKINIDELKTQYPNKIDALKTNIEAFHEAADYIEKYLIGLQYADSLKDGVKRLLTKMKLDKSSYESWASDIDELSKKFSGMLLHSSNISQFINQIKRISIGTMNLNEFKKIYEANKHKMIKKPIKESLLSFISFNEYNLTYDS